jgi:hypothetical protein
MYFISMLWSRTCANQLYLYALVKNIWRSVETKLFLTIVAIYFVPFFINLRLSNMNVHVLSISCYV